VPFGAGLTCVGDTEHVLLFDVGTEGNAFLHNCRVMNTSCLVLGKPSNVAAGRPQFVANTSAG